MTKCAIEFVEGMAGKTNVRVMTTEFKDATPKEKVLLGRVAKLVSDMILERSDELAKLAKEVRV